MNMIILYEDMYLAHHGIKGQRWGIRRFQNVDGTLTPEGKERYGVGGSPKEKARIGDLVGKSISSETEFIKSSGLAASDRKIKKQILKVLSNQENYKIRSAIELSNKYKDASDKLNNAFFEFSKKMSEDTGKEWDGDGTEEHWALEKRYPEYKELSENEQRLKKKLVDKCISLAKSDEFSKIEGFEKYDHYYDSYPEHGDWYKKGDQRAFAIAQTLLCGKKDPYSTDASVNLNPELFIENFDKNGNKLKSSWTDDKVIDKNYNDFRESGSKKGGLESWTRKAAKDGTLYEKLDDLYDRFDEKHGKLLDNWWKEREKVRGSSIAEENAFQEKYAKQMAKDLNIPVTKSNLFILSSWFFTWDD